ncbi:hypothetical protein [Petroclostridium sp. X23]|uniref:hypothetical protein n=1 Tax=Petroclostridium sp. X23 TaxID=3045146 RepID=UPI0024ACAD27|nr:hypothetical protein [Petroclostridium sp. X23]WHH60638.1 hypothetical protein QKW49_08015 [Petroclostridium sp. X23]
MTVFEFKEKLVYALSVCNNIKGIGQTGNINLELVPGYSDIDLFVLCSMVPNEEERRQLFF